MPEILLVFGMFLVTFGVRYPLLVLVGKIHLPESMFRALRYVPVAVLTAIITPAMLYPENSLDMSLQNSYLVGGIVAVGIAIWRRDVLTTIVLGMVVFLFWRFVIL